MHRIFYFLSILFLSLCSACTNYPYSSDEKHHNVYYDTFKESPKHLDPAIAYSSDEYNIIQQIVEPPLQYHFFTRPYTLVPLTTTHMPTVQYFSKGKKVSMEHHHIDRVEYTLTFKKSIKYHPHPAFSKDKNQNYRYHLGNKTHLPSIKHPNNLKHRGSRFLQAEDYAYQIKRLAHPQVACPIYPLLSQYILGLREFTQQITREIAKVRKQRKKQLGKLYNELAYEKEHPIYIDLRKLSLPGVQVLPNNQLKIILKQLYPQFIYWLAMPFFAPTPWEVDRFYTQKVTQEQNITLDRFPVGTGPYFLAMNLPYYRMELHKNTNYHGVYPVNNIFRDNIGKSLPFLDRAIYSLEKESIPRWNKFLQGYYDASNIQADLFDNAIHLSSVGDKELSPELNDKGISLVTSSPPLIYYYAFNMLDPVVGGYSIQKQKLRQAISIILNIEEYIDIFLNGQGTVAHSPIPPNVFGYKPNNKNTFIYQKLIDGNSYIRHPVSYAKKLLKQAGYGNSKTSGGKRLTISYDTIDRGADKSELHWLRKQFNKLNIDLQIRLTDYNQFRQKVNQGNFQLIRWGWHADYPDPENFLFLLHGRDSTVRFGGKNSANYQNTRYDHLFDQMSIMVNSTKRQKIIDEMINILRKDAAWIFGFYPINYILSHSWYINKLPMEITYGTLKYRQIRPQERIIYHEKWNQPLFLLPLLLLCISFLIYILWRKKVIRAMIRQSI